MCGIAGFVGPKKFIPKLSKIKACLSVMWRRGPDANGTFIKKSKIFSFLFLHSRLSIIDLQKKSNQPFEDKNGVLSFNGEIYNYKELRDLCTSKGVKFNTNSDTEVLLKTLNLYGQKALNLLDGMWAFSYYNKINKEIIISRDRFGEKPLYYIKNKHYLLFASNINYLRQLYSEKLNLNKEKILRFLSFGFSEVGFNQKTIFQDVNTLFPGHSIIINKKNKFKIKKFWNIKIKKNHNISYQKSVVTLTRKLKNILNTRFRSDVPLAALLSGGIDSSSIAGIAKELNVKLECFSVKPNMKEYNEDKYINDNIKYTNFKHNFVRIPKKDNLTRLRKIIKHSSSLLPSTTAFAYALVCNKIKSQGYKVLLGGIGGDEFFGGYYHHFPSYLFSLKKRKEFKQAHEFWKKNITQFIRSEKLKDYNKFKKMIKNQKRSHLRMMNHHEDDELKKYFLHKQDRPKIKTYTKDFFYNVMFQDIFLNAVPSQLEMADGISMYHSIEARSPFLSPDLLEYVFSLPKSYLFKKGPKSLLRDAIDDHVPKLITKNFNKIGWYCSFTEIFNKDKAKIKKIILESDVLKQMIKIKEVTSLLKQKRIKHSESKFLFSVVNIAILEELYA